MLKVALDEEVAQAELHVGPRAVGDLILRVAERPSALVCVLRAAAVGPARKRVGVGRRLFEFVGHDGDRAVNARVAVRTRGLRGAGRETTVGVADERVADVTGVRVSGGVPAAVARAEARSLGDVRRRDDEVDAVGVIRETAVADGVVDDVEDFSVAQARALRACVRGLAAEGDGAGDVVASGAVGRVE